MGSFGETLSSLASSRQQGRRASRSTTLGVAVAVLLVVILSFADTPTYPTLLSEAESILVETQADRTALAGYTTNASEVARITESTTATYLSRDPRNPLAIPPGQAPNLPSIRENNANVDQKRKIYGGAGDKKHLGGFTDIDIHGISPSVWKHMITDYGVHSVLDVGCGRGISTSWFLLHGADVLCVEGSHDAVEKSVMPNPENQVVEHDYSRGPWWPEKTYDAAWAVEFLEHVNVQYHFNYISTFRKAALIFATSSRWGGWHHVEVHPDTWWIRKFESYGLKYDAELTEQVRMWAKQEQGSGRAPNGEPLKAQHIAMSIKVFVNPIVAALPEHAHLFPEFGCYKDRKEGKIVNRECGTGARNADLETKLHPSFYPLKLTESQDKAWETLIRKNIQSAK